jgi:hypothetical protein
MADAPSRDVRLLLSGIATLVHSRELNLLRLRCLKHGFPSYVDAPRHEGSILNRDARDYDVSI